MHQNKRIIMWLKNKYDTGNENVKTVIEALEKQIPKKPMVRGLGQRYCIVCGFGGADNLYCSRCGQRLKEGDA